jgi:magnesium and cobalt transporter
LKDLGFLRKLFFREEWKSDGESGLSLEKRDMIRGIVELSETTVKEVMVPRIDVAFVSNELEIKEVIEKVAESGFSRYPVYKETIDNVIGILYAKDILQYLGSNQDPPDLEKVIRKPFFVPESKRLDSLLREMKKRRVHIAVAVDEYGGVSGIVCLEDILEEIVGDIQDEFDNEREDILEIGDKVYLCDARMDIEELNLILQTHIPDKDFDTLGGFVFDLFGKIPVKYEKVRYKDLEFIIQDMDGHKIKTVKIVAGSEEKDADG